jgi:L,D-transpeptidase YcbB
MISMMAEFLHIALFFILSLPEFWGNHGNSFNERLVNRYYMLNQHRLAWFSPDSESVLRRQSFKNNLDSCRYIGLDKRKYHYQDILEHVNDLFLPEDSITAMQTDRIFTDAAIMYGLDIFRGAEIPDWIIADQISPKFLAENESFVINQMIALAKENNLTSFVKTLEPQGTDYKILKSTLRNYIDTADVLKIRQLTTSINQFRWIDHFKLGKFVLVNIPSASLSYYENDSVQLKMKVVLGKRSTRTPRFAAYCDQLILFPYWNVPHSIAVKEFLPIFKKNPAMVSSMNMQILDNRGNIIPEDKINWSMYSKTNFPYRIRQSTGCDNALGVIKFNLTSPFDVYMHDTNMKSAFKSGHRYYSHGCIRLEKPFQLANYFLGKPLDSIALVTQTNIQNPKTLPLYKPVPVFVVYMSAEINADQVLFYPDVYKLLK